MSISQEPLHARRETFVLSKVLQRIEKAVAPFEKAALFALYEQGHRSVFEILVACMISIRTRDEVTMPLSRQLFARASTPKAVLKLGLEELTKALHGMSYPRVKAENILWIAHLAEKEYDGVLPADEELLLSLPGIGPKCANLILGIAGQKTKIAVDIHVHRVCNRWGYVEASSPEKTLHQLEAKVPPQKRIDINRLLMPFGKHICTGTRPHCSTCPVESMCPKLGVTSHR